MTAKLLTDEQERFLIGLLPCNNNIFLASMLNLKFNLRLTAKQINNWKKSHKPKKPSIPKFKITKKIRGWRHGN
jgi:hypothetical protein